MLASVSGFRINSEAINSSARNRSAFCEGGSGGADVRKMLARKGNKARRKRIGRMVKV